MTIFIFDGTFEGFVSSLPYLWQHSEYGDKLQAQKSHNPEFFTPSVTITDELIIKTGTPGNILFRKTASTLIYCYSSKDHEATEKAPSFISYIKNTGIKGFSHLAEPSVNSVIKAAKKTLAEAHKLKGLLRFRQIRSILYGPYFSKNFVLPNLGRHFRKRLPNQQWLLHDTEHKTGLFYNGKILRQAFFDDKKALELEKIYKQSGLEDNFEILWKKYFNTVAIKERNNPKLQQSFMPKQYWRFIPEVACRVDPCVNPNLGRHTGLPLRH